MEKINTIIVSDIHLGSPISQKAKLKTVLDLNFKRLIINGDLFDSISFHRYKKQDWSILNKIRKLTKTHEVIFVHGNHDENVELISSITGMELVENYSFKVNEKSFYAEHGDQYDYWIKYKPFMTFIFTGIYYWIQKLNKSQKLARKIKSMSKSVVKAKEIVSKKFVEKHGEKYDVLLAGHTHFPEIKVFSNCQYVNSGSFCENLCSYVVVYEDGSFDIEYI